MTQVVTDRKHTRIFETFFVAALVGERIALRAWEFEQRLPKMMQVVIDRKHTRIFDTFFRWCALVGAAHAGEPGDPRLPIYGTESTCSSAFHEFWVFSAGSSKPAGRRRGPFARRFSGVLQSSAAAKTAFANVSQSSCGYSPERTVRFPCLGPPFTIGSQTQVFSRVRSSGALESSTVGFIIGKFWNFRP